MHKISIEFTKSEYNELLKKLANQLETYNKYASEDLKSVYIKLLDSNPWKRMEMTPLMEKWSTELKKTHNTYYPQNQENSLAAAEFAQQK